MRQLDGSKFTGREQADGFMLVADQELLGCSHLDCRGKANDCDPSARDYFEEVGIDQFADLNLDAELFSTLALNNLTQAEIVDIDTATR